MRGCWEAAVEIDRRLALARQFGTFTQAYSTAVQQGLEHFWHHDCYLAYRKKWGVACVLADPVGPAELHEPLLRAFVGQFRKTCFYNLKGHADFKRRFCGVEEQTYYASDCLFNDFRVIASLKTAGALLARIRKSQPHVRTPSCI